MVLSDLDPAGTCAHMNADHAESLKAYLMFFANIKDCEKGEMLDVDEKGFLLRAFFSDGRDPVDVRVDYPDGPIEDAVALRAVAEEMHATAYKGLGWVDPGMHPEGAGDEAHGHGH